MDIQFGDLEETRPERSLRPDRNKHFAVAPYENPVETDLPIFVDLDVVRDMETHALTDTNVELGGVLLGGQYEDDDGKPFVVITDSLRAEHYEATKGSFKFTHETWEQITRQREEFPEDLQMVGWYHTHPDWGVFLSGMDMFICDNFFNKELDVALVIDPCRQDRAMFMWTGDPAERVRRCAGFYIIASRYRAEELAFYSAQLEGNFNMPADPRFSGIAGHVGPSPPPVVNISRAPENPWVPLAVMGMLMMQFLLVSLIAWKSLVPQNVDEKQQQREEERYAEVTDKIDRMYVNKFEDAELTARREALDEVARGLTQQDNVAERIEQLQLEINSLRAERATAKLAQKERQDIVDKLASDKKLLETRVSRLTSKSEGLEEDNATLAARLKEVKKEKEALEGGEEGEPITFASFFKGEKLWWTVGVSVLVLLVVGVSIAFALRRDDDEYESQLATTPKSKDQPQRATLKKDQPPTNNPEEGKEPPEVIE